MLSLMYLFQLVQAKIWWRRQTELCIQIRTRTQRLKWNSTTDRFLSQHGSVEPPAAFSWKRWANFRWERVKKGFCIGNDWSDRNLPMLADLERGICLIEFQSTRRSLWNQSLLNWHLPSHMAFQSGLVDIREKICPDQWPRRFLINKFPVSKVKA